MLQTDGGEVGLLTFTIMNEPMITEQMINDMVHEINEQLRKRYPAGHGYYLEYRIKQRRSGNNYYAFYETFWLAGEMLNVKQVTSVMNARKSFDWLMAVSFAINMTPLPK